MPPLSLLLVIGGRTINQPTLVLEHLYPTRVYQMPIRRYVCDRAAIRDEHPMRRDKEESEDQRVPLGMLSAVGSKTIQ